MNVASLALVLSFTVGLLSLSQEIIWVRFVGFGLQGRPHAFSIVLIAFLVGIALGSMAGRQLCKSSRHLVRAAALVLLAAGTIDLIILQASPHLLADMVSSQRRLAMLVGVIALTACLKGVLFPVVHHLGADATAGRVGRSVSRVYLGNVIGASLGPLVAGFWLLDVTSAERAFALVGLCTIALGVLTALATRPGAAWMLVPVVLLASGVACVVRPPDSIAAMAKHDAGGPVKHVIQNKHGVIHVLEEDKPGTGDITMGGNIYDGRISVDMTVNSNALDRAYIMAAMHPAPRKALVVGLSTGAWTRVIAGLDGIASVDVVEINRGYLDLIARYPVVAPVLSDPRISINIDDGRRWLRRRPERTYDLIFQNTTFHWRAYSTLLLSREYLRELKSHLNPGGIIAINTTESADVYVTALEVFPHVIRYRNFVYMSDKPLAKRPDAIVALRNARIGDARAFADALFEPGRIGHALATAPLQPAREYVTGISLDEPDREITDLNLLPEYRHGSAPPVRVLRHLLPPSPLDRVVP